MGPGGPRRGGRWGGSGVGPLHAVASAARSGDHVFLAFEARLVL